MDGYLISGKMEQNIKELLTMESEIRMAAAVAVVVIAYLADFLCCRFLIPFIRKVAEKTSFKWDNYLASGSVLNNISHLIPPVALQIALPLLFPEHTEWTVLLVKALAIYTIVISCRLVNAFISSVYAMSSESEVLRDKPMKGVYQMLKVIVVFIGAILTIGVLLEKDFTALLAGIGASAAVLMLVFKDTILGVVAGIQLSAHDMLRPGDWIMMDRHGVNGEVEEVTLNTVKVRNWDNTIVTVPPYALVSDSFKNWRGMRESAGRRVARVLYIDMNSIRFCTPEELSRYSTMKWAEGVEMGPETVNLKLFRVAAENYISSLDGTNTDLMLLVRQLEPTSEGLPLQFYFFTKAKDWISHEKTAADVIEHMVAVMPQFGLRIYQRPSGLDIRKNEVSA